METKNPDNEDRVKAVQILSNLCGIKRKVQGLTDKMRDLIDTTNSGMSSVEKINQFLDQLEQFQCIVIKDLNKTGEVARCQYRVINDIEAFMDTLKNRQRRLRNMCLDIKEGDGPDMTLNAACICCTSTNQQNSQQGQQQLQQQQTQQQPLQSLQQQPQQQPYSQPQFPVSNTDYDLPYGDANAIVNFSGQENTIPKKTELFISDIHPLGKYIKITNPCTDKVQDLGGYLICQIVEGCDYGQFSLFRFPLRVGLPPGESLKVWSRCYDPGLCRSPRDLVAEEVNKWCTTNEVVTKLCDSTDDTVCWIKGCRVGLVPGF